MKKLWIYCIVLILSVTLLPVQGYAAKAKIMPKRVVLTQGSYKIAVDNGTYKLDDSKPYVWPGIYEEMLLVPIKPLADIFHGTYSIDKKANKAKLTLDNVKFEFELYENKAKINGKGVTLPYETRLDGDAVKVPAKAFVGTLQNYDVLVVSESAMVIREKGKVNFYDKSGAKIGLTGTKNIEKWATTYSKGLKSNDRDIITEIDKKANEIVAKITTSGMNDYEKVLAVYNYLYKDMNYVFKLYADKGGYNSILSNQLTTDGMAHMASILLEKMGIESIYVTGYQRSRGIHDIDEYETRNFGVTAWNLVKIDGKYLHMDATVERATLTKYNHANYAGFLLTDKQMSAHRIWRTDFYPVSNDDVLSDRTVQELKSKGYTVISGDIVLQGGARATEDTDVQIYVGEYRSFDDRRTLLRKAATVNKGTNSQKFTIVLDKQYNTEYLVVSGSNVELDRDYEYVRVIDYEVTQQGKPDQLKFALSPNAYRTIKGTIQLPEGVQFTSPLNFRVTLTTFHVTDTGGHSHGNDDTSVYKGYFKPGEREASIEFKSLPRNDHYRYTVTYYFDQLVGGKMIELPIENLKSVDHRGQAVEEGYMIDGNEHPLQHITIQVPKSSTSTTDNVEPAKASFDGTAITDLKKKLKEYNVGNHAAMKKLRSVEDGKKLEKTPPVEIGSNGVIYYSDSTSSGIQLFRSYAKHSTSKYLQYSVTINQLDITATNFADIVNMLNGYMKDALGEKKLATIQLQERGKPSQKWNSSNAAKTYEQVSKGYANMIASYTKDHVQYEILLIGNPQSRTVSVSITTRVSQ